MRTTRLLKNFGRLHVALPSILAIFFLGCSAAGSSDPASLVAKLDTKLPEVVEQGNSPSIQVAVISQDQVIWSEAYGENTSVEHVYMNASVQKVFTATAVMQLVEKGLVDLDADVNSYVPFQVRHPGYPQTPITLRMLLALSK